jgi:hypothetical protein
MHEEQAESEEREADGHQQAGEDDAHVGLLGSAATAAAG